jgi:hypothetical protein
VETLGLYSDLESAAAAVETLIQRGFAENDVTSISSGPYPEGVLVREERPSFFRWITLAGGIAGAGAGFLLAAGTAWLYPLHTGHKPIISLFPVGIITYEFTMLFAILGTIAGMFLEMGLPAMNKRVYDPEISSGLIGILVACKDASMQGKARQILQDTGAIKIRNEGES